MGHATRWGAAARMGAALTLTATLVACGGQTVLTQGDVTLLVHGDSLLPRGGTDALIVGRLALRNGCVGLASEAAPDVVMAVIWPSGTGLEDDDPLSVRLPSGSLLAAGQSVRGAGGYHAPDAAAVTVDIPASCDFTSPEVAVFNPDDDPVAVD